MDFLEKYSTIIITSIIIAEALITFLVVWYYRKLRKKTLYSYEGAGFLGGSIFMVTMLVFSVLILFNTNIGINPVLAYINDLSGISTYFPIFALPLLIAFFFTMGISNISLVRHEGKTVKNVIGSVLGFLLVAATVAGVFGWDIIYQNIIFKLTMKGYRWVTVFDIAIPQFLTSLLCYVECLLMGVIISSIHAAKHQPAFDKDYVIILGCAIAKDGKPLPLLRSRIDRAIQFAREQAEANGKRIKFVTSGGKGDDECISEAESMRDYLLLQGIDENDIIVENKSVNTLENMRFSKALIEKDNDGKNVIYSTTNYHVFRSGIYAEKAGIKAEGIAAKTKWYFWMNAFIREFIALLVNEKKGHILNAITFFVISILSGICFYISIS